MLKLSDQECKLWLKCYGLQCIRQHEEQMGNVRRDTEILRKNQKEMLEIKKKKQQQK